MTEYITSVVITSTDKAVESAAKAMADLWEDDDEGWTYAKDSPGGRETYRNSYRALARLALDAVGYEALVTQRDELILEIDALLGAR